LFILKKKRDCPAMAYSPIALLLLFLPIALAIGIIMGTWGRKFTSAALPMV